MTRAAGSNSKNLQPGSRHTGKGIGTAPELVASANRLEAACGPLLYYGLSLADLAHIVLLNEAGIVPNNAARKLLTLLLEMHQIKPDQFIFDPALGDSYKNREKYVTRLEPEAGGWLRTGRARREAVNVAYHITLRHRLLGMHSAICKFAGAMADIAGKNAHTIMPDFTYLQHAQPTTFAHYLLGFVFPALRDLDRIKSCFYRVNLCPGGIGSVNGSRLLIDREKLAVILGFNKPVLHTRDAMWLADIPIEIMSTIAAAVTNIDRLGEDLQIWVTSEFDLIDLEPSFCRESVIMPQKKNPYGLAFIRGAASVMAGRLAAMAAVGRTASGQPDNRIFAYHDVPESLDLAVQCIELMAGTVSTLSVNTKTMAKSAAEGYSQATDLAEVIMQETGLPYLTAHKLVTEVVKQAASKNIPSVKISGKLIDLSAKNIIGRELRLSKTALKLALDPANIVNSRLGLGGAAPARVAEMLAEVSAAILDAQKWNKKMTDNIKNSEYRLVKKAQLLSAGTN